MYSTFAQTCSCSGLLKELVIKTESDYAGYIHKVKEKDGSSYIQLKELLFKKAAKTSFKNCYDVLENYTGFFNDGHLFITEFPSKQPDSLYASVEKYPLPDNYEAILDKKQGKDAIEGVWKGANELVIDIIKTGATTFYGVIRHTLVPKWLPGMVKMKIEKTKNSGYKIAYFRNDFAEIHFANNWIYKNVSLAFGIYRLAKVYPVDPESQYIHPDDPQLPIIKVIDKENVLLTIPSALIERNYLDSLLEKHSADIRSAPNLIIDIRGNGGGNFIWGGVYDIVNTIVKPSPKDPKMDDFQLLASADDADYFYNQGSYYRQQKDSSGIKFYDDLVNKIRKNTGKIIGASWYDPIPDTATRTVYQYPRRVAIIIDKGVASAAEAFIMGAKEISSKIILYGNNTHGMIDYMNVNTIPLGCGDNPWYYFGYPTIFSNEIKTKPLNPTGIPADIYIPPNVSDWVQWVVGHLKRE